jgi:hypothetical protein
VTAREALPVCVSGRPLSVAERNPPERVGRTSLILEVEDPEAQRGSLDPAFTPPSSEITVQAVKLDVTFLMDFDGFGPAFRLVNGMVIIDSFPGFDRLETESADLLVAVRGIVYR